MPFRLPVLVMYCLLKVLAGLLRFVVLLRSVLWMVVVDYLVSGGSSLRCFCWVVCWLLRVDLCWCGLLELDWLAVIA